MSSVVVAPAKKQEQPPFVRTLRRRRRRSISCLSGPHLPSSFRTIPVPYPTTPKRDLPMLVPTTDDDDDRRRRRRCARARPMRSAAPRSATARGILRPSRPIRRRTKPTCSLAALRLRLRLACERASGASENGPFADSGPGRPLPAGGGGGEKRSVVEAGGGSASGRFRKVRGMRRGRDWEGREGREGIGRWDWTSRDTGIPSLAPCAASCSVRFCVAPLSSGLASQKMRHVLHSAQRGGLPVPELRDERPRDGAEG